MSDLSQQDIDALLAENTDDEQAEAEVDMEAPMSPQQIDAMGEIGNISMGTSATTLSTMINHRVEITTPKVVVTTLREIAKKHPLPFVAVQVEYTKGLLGTNILFLRVDDVKTITDLMMGGDGTNTDMPLNDMHLSAISEVMNQMVGSSSTSLSKLINASIDISPPVSYEINLAEDVAHAPLNDVDQPLVQTCFQMEVEDLIQSEIMQVMPVEFAVQMVEGLLGGGAIAAAEATVPSTEEVIRANRRAEAPLSPVTPSSGTSPLPPSQAPAPPAGSLAHVVHRGGEGSMGHYPVEAVPATFDGFASTGEAIQTGDKNMELLMDVPLPVSVELGKSRKFIKEILEFNVGSIIVLDKMAGDMVDVVVNGKLIAKAEVVVIDDNYGARITDIITPAKRIGSA